VSYEIRHDRRHRLLHHLHRHSRLFHLLKGDLDTVRANLTTILATGTMRGGTGFIRDEIPCVCWSELTVAEVGQFLADPDALDQEYKAYGLVIDKLWLFARGGRPVIYQPDAEYELLHETQRFRHMRYEPDDDFDFSWIREWRVPAEALSLDRDKAAVLLPDRAALADLERRLGPEQLAGWQVVCLADLGVQVVDD
jgi:hypothetical protein